MSDSVPGGEDDPIHRLARHSVQFEWFCELQARGGHRCPWTDPI